MYTPSPSQHFTDQNPSNSTPSQPPPHPSSTPPHTSQLPSPPPHSTSSASTYSQVSLPLCHTSPLPKGIATVDFDLVPANISQSPPLPSHSPQGIARVSFDVEPANISESPSTRKTLSPTHTTPLGHPTTLHTISDSPHHHRVTLPLMCPQQPKTDIDTEMVVAHVFMPQSRNIQLKNTFLQGTFSPKRPTNILPIDRPSPSVAQATEDVRVVQEKPHPPPIASSEASNREPVILKSIIPGKFPKARQLDPHAVIFSQIVSA